MANFKIPDRYKRGFAILASLPEPIFARFYSAAEKAPKTFATVRQLEAWIAPEVEAISSDHLASLISSVSSLYRFVSKHGAPIPRLASEVLEAARIGTKEFNVAEGSSFTERLEKLLALQSFNLVSFKARELQQEAERTFVDARILTDLRPIFGEEIDGEPSGMFVVHTLRLLFHEVSEHRELYIALDQDDIKSLKKGLERAEEKTKVLTALLAKKEIPLIDLP